MTVIRRFVAGVPGVPQEKNTETTHGPASARGSCSSPGSRSARYAEPMTFCRLGTSAVAALSDTPRIHGLAWLSSVTSCSPQ